jgi:hypothetical protein
MLLEVRSALPLSVIGSFRPRLKLMWPAGLMTGNVSVGREVAELRDRRGNQAVRRLSSAPPVRATCR